MTSEQIVAKAVRQKARWKPTTWDADDMVQEAWVGFLEAQHAGVTDPKELLRRTELRLITLMARENRRNKNTDIIPALGLGVEDEAVAEGVFDADGLFVRRDEGE